MDDESKPLQKPEQPNPGWEQLHRTGGLTPSPGPARRGNRLTTRMAGTLLAQAVAIEAQLVGSISEEQPMGDQTKGS